MWPDNDLTILCCIPCSISFAESFVTCLRNKAYFYLLKNNHRLNHLTAKINGMQPFHVVTSAKPMQLSLLEFIPLFFYRTQPLLPTIPAVPQCSIVQAGITRAGPGNKATECRSLTLSFWRLPEQNLFCMQVGGRRKLSWSQLSAFTEFQINVPLPEHGLFSVSCFWVKGVTKLMEAKCCILVIDFLKENPRARLHQIQ